MRKSSNGNIFSITGPLWGEFTGHRWIPLTMASDAEFVVFFDLRLNKQLSKQSWGWWFEMPSHSLRCHCNDTFSSLCLYLPVLLTASTTSLSNTIAHLILHHLDPNLICPSPIYLGSICIPFTRTISLRGFLFLLAPLMMWVTKSSKSTSPCSILWHFLDPRDSGLDSLNGKTSCHQISRSLEAPKWYLKQLYRTEMWQAPQQHCCWDACQISER